MDQEVKEKGNMWVPLKKIKIKNKKEADRRTGRESIRFLLFLFLFSLASLFDIRKSDRRNSSS